MARNLIITGGIYHPFETTAPALARLLDGLGIASTVTEDVEAGLAAVSRGEYDLLTIYALRWRMLGDEKYAPFRARWAMSLSPAGRTAIAAHAARGGGLFGLHTASICFDDWPEWRDILGGVWIRGQSGHPPYGAARVRMLAVDHPLTRGLGDFALDDEVYGRLSLADDVTPLMEAAAADGDWQPMLWARRVGAGRVVYDALGHDNASLDHPTHRRIIARAALWALGRPDREVAAA
jgi:hypothetical protein